MPPVTTEQAIIAAVSFVVGFLFKTKFPNLLSGGGVGYSTQQSAPGHDPTIQEAVKKLIEEFIKWQQQKQISNPK